MLEVDLWIEAMGQRGTARGCSRADRYGIRGVGYTSGLTEFGRLRHNCLKSRDKELNTRDEPSRVARPWKEECRKSNEDWLTVNQK
jgi:hypothetical protein